MNTSIAVAVFLLSILTACTTLQLPSESIRAYDQEDAKIIYFLEPENSSISFNVPRNNSKGISGVFSDYNVNLIFPNCDMKNGFLDVRINADSATMGNPLFESVLTSKSWFNTKDFPFIQYTSDNVNINQQSVVTGILTVRDISQPVSIDVSYENLQELKESDSLQFTGRARFNRLDFNMTSFQSLVGTDVIVSVSGVFQRQVNQCSKY